MRLVVTSLVSAVCVFCGCGMGEDDKPACEENEEQCPRSSRLATDVACDCRCVAGFSGLTPTRSFEGTISACLPPELNPVTATPEQRDAALELRSAQFNQRVFKFCSDKVAGYLDDLIEMQQRPRDLQAMCMGPRIRCKCTTTGAQQQTSVCSTPCVDRECDKQNCLPLLRVGGSVDASGCSCSRVNECGNVTPNIGESPICLNRPAAILRRQANRRRSSREDRTQGGRSRQRSTTV
ncbi:MAG: hypothetical protein BGO98_08910 [Myxococcales bacterium 68-20]|nr:MAG: hypothetical protein BGO98_08910 [Myxococcales bacterium 68-20]